MASATFGIELEGIRETFRQWRAEQEPLEAQLCEAMAALLAYQSQLDRWQRQLVQEREQLREAQEQFERDQRVAEKVRRQKIAELTAELTAECEKNVSLTAQLQARTEELQSLDNLRAELSAQVELTRAQERELRRVLAETIREHEEERLQWANELQKLQEALQHRVELEITEPSVAISPESQVTEKNEQNETKQTSVAVGAAEVAGDGESPVFGSILQQFGKLRRQRAMGRQGQKIGGNSL
jgi:predicted  nucleic acid-binding Zn-ribbon protein